jgi:hypothetical protein
MPSETKEVKVKGRSEPQTQVKVKDELEARSELQALQALIDRSVRTATPSVADSVAYPDRQMSAAEFVEFWQSVRLVAMATVGEGGRPHIAPVHASLHGVTLRLVIYDNTVRRADLARNPRVSFTTWRADGAAAIVYGRAHEVAGSLRPARPGRSGKPRQVVEIEVKLTRVYAMRPPSAA